MAASAAQLRDDSKMKNSEVLVGRQPIFTADLQVHGYELLYRSLANDQSVLDDVDQATAEIITAGFMDIGLNTMVENKLAYIHVSREFLASREVMALPAERVALQFSGCEAFDDEFIELLDEYRSQGYRLVVDAGNINRDNLAVIKRAHAVKIDVRELGIEEAKRQVGLIAKQREVLVCHVESEEEFAALEELGVQYFEGFFFAQPKIISGKRVASNKLTVLRLLARLYSAEIQVDEIADLISRDAGLSYKLMRFINSAAFSLPGEIESIQRAVVYMGLSALKRWASLIVVASVDDKPTELTRTLLVRARFCEQLCTQIDYEDPGSGFTVGLFSGLNALLDQPLNETLDELPLSDGIKAALLEHSGILGEALVCVLAYECGEWFDLSFQDLSPSVIGSVYEESLTWSSEAMNGM